MAAFFAVLLAGAFICLALPERIGGCIFAGLFNRPCPVCGLTHAICFFLEGDCAGSLRFHPLGPLGGCLCVIYLLYFSLVALCHVSPLSWATEVLIFKVSSHMFFVGIYVVWLVHILKYGG